jgi:hypothetical protein
MRIYTYVEEVQHVFRAILYNQGSSYRLCDLVVRVPAYISRDPGSIPGAATFSEK